MSEFRKPVGLPSYSQYQRPSQVPTQRMSTPSQSGYQGSKSIDQIIDDKEKKSDDPYFLEEEEYLEMMSKIIRRDFFPEKISEEERQQLELDPKLKQLKLNDFVRNYKSEDNETFKQIMEKEEQKWRDKYWWMFLAEKKDRVNQLALENGENSERDTIKRMIAANPEKPLAITNVESHNSMFFMPQYQPPAVIQKSNLDIKSREEKINYSNTRFDEEIIQEDQDDNVKKIVTRMVSDLDVNSLSTPFLLGMGYYNDPATKKPKNYKYNLEELMNGRNNQDHSKDHQVINGYQIHSMPSPAPNQMASPFITWGEVEDTPVRLNEKTNFQIREASDREKLASNMASNIQRTKAIQKKQNQEILKKAMSSGTPLKVATILSSSHGNSLVKSILQSKLQLQKDQRQLTKQKLKIKTEKLTGKSSLGLNSSKTPLMGKTSSQTPLNKQEKKANSSSTSTQQGMKQEKQEETPLLKF